MYHSSLNEAPTRSTAILIVTIIICQKYTEFFVQYKSLKLINTLLLPHYQYCVVDCTG